MNRENTSGCSTSYNHFEIRLSHFCDLIDNLIEPFILQDQETILYCKNNIDIIFYFLRFNYECTCTHNQATEIETLAEIEEVKYVLPTKNNNTIIINVPILSCNALQYDIIEKVVKLVCCFNSAFRCYFNPCLKKLSQNQRFFNRDCKHLEWFISMFCQIFEFFVFKERNDSFMNRTFVDMIIDNCDLYNIQSLLYLCLTKNSFVAYFNQIDVIEKLNRLITVDNINALNILNYLIEKRNDRLKCLINYGWNYAKYCETLCDYESKYFELFLGLENEYDYTVVYNFLCKILELEHNHFHFVKSYYQYLVNVDFDFQPKSIDLRFLYITRLLVMALKYSGRELNAIVECKGIIQKLFDLFFKFDECTYHHQNVYQLVNVMFLKNLSVNFRLIIIIINMASSMIFDCGREFFARENDANGVLPSLHAYCLELKNEMKELQKRCNKIKDKKVNMIRIALDKSFSSDKFYYVKWYFLRCFKKEKLSLEVKENVEAFLEDCIGETHIRYIYYKILCNFPYNKLFDMI